MKLEAALSTDAASESSNFGGDKRQLGREPGTSALHTRSVC